MTARQAIILEARQSQRVHSISATIDVRSPAVTMSGTVQVRMKPYLAAGSFRASADGQRIPVSEIQTGQAVYFKIPELSGRLGKPWMTISFSGLPGKLRSGVPQLFQGIANSNPLTQATMLAGATNVRAAGMQAVDGVPTTHYTGSYPVTATLAKLPSSVRTAERKALQGLGIKSVSFNAWIDARHQLRKLAIVAPIPGNATLMTMTITSVNQPVHVALPPASQVAAIPASALRGGCLARLAACSAGHGGGPVWYPGTGSYAGHGVSFRYPAGWLQGTPGGPACGCQWATGVGLDPPDTIYIFGRRMGARVTAQNLSAVTPSVTRAVRGGFRLAGDRLLAGPQAITVGGMPALRFQGTKTHPDGQGTLTIVFNGMTRYDITGDSAPAKARAVQQGCAQVLRTFKARS
ncbi:MAG: hypothetical protein LBV78_19355 [Kitasatospora sp.]|nr:hypothetical protein [Kitasatospora sp.]